MLSRAITASLLLVLAGCTNIKVEPVAPQYKISQLCIEENPKVVVGDFVDGLQTLLRKHNIDSRLYATPIPDSCEYRLTYTAIRSWDFSRTCPMPMSGSSRAISRSVSGNTT
ncbi:hypothetical protein EMIT0P44_130028 [Pseudomonas sp. IT-P44]|uniref:hypothetical protein n=1 Tax=Pseudomonas sp. IT-P44 TaxID=3026451 RepID=UPI0039DFA9DC